ncbi:MAG: hypothetical protein LBQ89_04175 [Treponema sp.]|jgi:hypothetical protein|nr:hypothetical protein [Treponema sp.]
MNSSRKGGNNRRNRERFSGRRDEAQRHGRKHSDNIFSERKFEKNRPSSYERPHWTAPLLPANPITTPDCPWCGKKITDITTAISDRDTGLPVHFDCVVERISKMETLEENDSICYSGGGRFMIVHYNNPPDTKDYTIKKVLEWEAKDNKNEWRKPISEYYSIT